MVREKLNYREGETERTPVYKYYSTWTTKAFDVILNFNYSWPLKRAITYMLTEGRGVCMVTSISVR